MKRSQSKYGIEYKKLIKLGAALISLGSLIGCETIKPDWQSETNPIFAKEATSLSSSKKETNEIESKEPHAQVFAGEEVAKPTLSRQHIDTQRKNIGGNIVLSFVETPIRDAVQLILGDHLGAEYSVAPEVQGSVSLNNQGGLAAADLIPTLEVLLSSLNAQLVQQGDAYRVIAGAKNHLPLNQSNLEILPLRYIDAGEFAKVLQGYQVSATAIKSGNLLALNGPSSKIKQVRTLAQSFDVNWLKGMSIGMFPVKNTSAQTLREELLELFGKKLDQELAGALRIVAIERSNTIMVIAAQRDSVEMMGEWVERLDQIGGASNQQFFIYRVQNGRATDLAELLRHMFGSGVPKSDDTPLNEAQLTPRSNHNSGEFRVIADESSNSVIVSGSPHYYKAVRQAMKELDSTPLQVLVEARIMELTLKDDLRYGLEWFLNGSRASTNTSSRLDFGNSGISAVQPGFSYVLERAGQVRAALNGLADDSRLKVLSSPSLMVLNNRTASILVGDEVPIPTRQAVSNISPEAPTVNEIEYRNTGILLTVTPRVNSGGMVTMDISQEVSSVVNNTSSQIDAPTIQQRQLNSTVSIRSGQTVVLGGLIREQDSDRESGVPLLKDLPALGKLFSTTKNLAQRTELVVLITPRVIDTEQDTDSITQEYRRKMIGLRPIPLNKL